MKNKEKEKRSIKSILAAALIGVLLALAAGSVQAQAKEPSMYSRCVAAKSRTGWCIVVKKSAHVCAIYKNHGSNRRPNWKQYTSYYCTIGKVKNGRSITRSGTFTVGKKYYYMDFKGSTGFYCTSMAGGSSGYIHTCLYKKGSRNINTAKSLDGRLGANLSEGCVRLPRWGAYFVYTYMPKDTKIVIF